MDRLREAVDRGIITHDQRRAIEALRPDPLRADSPGLSLVHVLWMAGCALVVFAMVLLAIELGGDDPGRLMWIGIVYAGVFAALDQGVKPRASLRLLSSMLVLSMAACLSLSIVAWQATVGEPSFLQNWSDPPWWSPFFFADASRDGIRRLDARVSGGAGGKWTVWSSEAGAASISGAWVSVLEQMATASIAGATRCEHLTSNTIVPPGTRASTSRANRMIWRSG